MGHGVCWVFVYLDRRIVWLATGVGWPVFMLGATYGHVYQTLREGNYAPYNFLTIFSFIGREPCGCCALCHAFCNPPRRQ
jgi:hypothetical protein